MSENRTAINKTKVCIPGLHLVIPVSVHSKINIVEPISYKEYMRKERFLKKQRLSVSFFPEIYPAQFGRLSDSSKLDDEQSNKISSSAICRLL